MPRWENLPQGPSLAEVGDPAGVPRGVITERGLSLERLLLLTVFFFFLNLETGKNHLFSVLGQQRMLLLFCPYSTERKGAEQWEEKGCHS